MIFIFDDAIDGKLNMRIDRKLFDLHVKGLCPPVFRAYDWSSRVITIGSKQTKTGINISKCEQNNIDIITRPTGGRAIIHEPGDFTFSIIGSANYGFPKGLSEAYKFVSRGLVEGLRLMGLDANLAEGKHNHKNKLCFTSSAIADIVYQDKKLCGCAQYREGDFFLEQGTIPRTKNRNLLKTLFDLENTLENDIYNDKTISLDEAIDPAPDAEIIYKSLVNGFRSCWGSIISEVDKKKITNSNNFFNMIPLSLANTLD